MKSNFLEFALSCFFPHQCPYCRKIIRAGLTECEECLRNFPKEPKKMMTPVGILCIAPFAYEAAVRNSIIDFKFHGSSFNARSYAKAICQVTEHESIIDKFDLITFVPLSKIRKNERGFNQSALVAEYVGEQLGKPVKPLLEKIRQNKNQHDLSFSERVQNVKGIYKPVNKDLIRDKDILLMDDIVTTGNTLAECCKVLKESGAGNIICMTIAVAGAV